MSQPDMTSYLAAVDSRPGGEPDWLPSPAEVSRARARMERLGVPQSLAGGPEAVEVAPGDVPWLWWAGAALWVLAWPVLVAFRAAGNWPGLPWWYLAVLPAVHMLLLALPVWLLHLSGSPDLVRRRFRRVRTLTQMLALEPGEFETWTALLFQLMGYRVRDTPETGDHGIDLEVFDAQERLGLVQCKRYRGTVGEPTVRDLYGTMVAAGADRAWLVTTGAVSRQAREWAEGKGIDLWDGQALAALAEQYG